MTARITPLDIRRETERDKYRDVAYRHPDYCMKGRRMELAFEDLAAVYQRLANGDGRRPSLLDVSCGRGELLAHARELGFLTLGTEVVEDLVGRFPDRHVLWADAWSLPIGDQSFDVVTCMDVIEHILPEDERRTLRELNRVSRRFVLITANNAPSRSLGVELHVNRQPYSTWDDHFREAFDGEVEWLHPGVDRSETWLIAK